MSNKKFFCLVHQMEGDLAVKAIREAEDSYVVRIEPATRTLDQNSAQFPYLTGFSEQLQWVVNGQMCWLTPLEWKDLLTCAFEGEINPRLAMGFDGGVVMLGRRTSQFDKNHL